ncbi:MAG: polymerase sigma-70 factor [Myxococcaceae bacterium]|jgi:RNA polymerase sigma-70 factor (ECF subfamily)|nr:polymerase sigma-70 factor [Myxococcaceae bacterium]
MADSRSDVELLGLIASGDVRAVGELYDRYSPTLFPIALRIVRDRSEAEDVLHDAFVAVNERARQYAADRGSVIAWLVTLVRNLSIDRTRRRDRRGTLARDVLPHEPPASVRDPERLTSDASEREKIRRALASLPEAQRQTLEIAFFEGLTYPEIAARENVPLGTIKSRAARALAALREALVKEGVTSIEGADVEKVGV